MSQTTSANIKFYDESKTITQETAPLPKCDRCSCSMTMWTNLKGTKMEGRYCDSCSNQVIKENLQVPHNDDGVQRG